MGDNFFSAAVAQMEAGNIDEALQGFMRHIESSPADYRGYLSVAHCHKLRQDNDLAIRYYEQALRFAPQNVEALYHCGECCLDDADYERAVELFDRARGLLSDPASSLLPTLEDRRNFALSRIYNKEAGVYFKAGDWKSALDYFFKALFAYTDGRTYTNIGVTYLNMGDEENAREYFIKSVETDPNYARGYYNLAGIQKDRGQWRSALDYYQTVLDKEPQGRDSADARQRMAECREALKEVRAELLEVLEGRKRAVNIVEVARLVSGYTGLSVGSVDLLMHADGKAALNAYTENGPYRIELADGEISVRKAG